MAPRLRLFSYIVFCLSLVACGDSGAPSSPLSAAPYQPPVTAALEARAIAPSPQAERFAGLPIPGRAADAQAAGFNHCTNQSYFSEQVLACRRDEPTELFGTQLLDPYVQFEGKMHLVDGLSSVADSSPSASNALSNPAYGSFRFGVSAADIAAFHESLVAHGWLLVGDRRGQTYQKRGLLLVVRIGTMREYYPVSIDSAALWEVQEGFARYDERQRPREPATAQTGPTDGPGGIGQEAP